MPTLINESGLYAVIMTGRTDQAKRFRAWVTGEVLPAIRRTGSYSVKPPVDLNDPNVLRGLLAAICKGASGRARLTFDTTGGSVHV